MRIVMVTDDVVIDRRILLEAESLIKEGNEVILIASWAENLPTHEILGNVKVERYVPVPSAKIESFIIKFHKASINVLNRTSNKIRNIFKKISIANHRGFCLLFSIKNKIFNKILAINQGFFKIAHLILRSIDKGFSWAIIKVTFFFERLLNFFYRINNWTITALLKCILFCITGIAKCFNRTQYYSIRLLRYFDSGSSIQHSIAKRIEFFKPDIIHVHDLPRLAAGIMAKKMTNAPVVYDAHELYPVIHTLSKINMRRLSKKEKKLSKLANSVITVNEFIAEEMAQRYKIKAPHVILNATNKPENFNPEIKYDLFRKEFNLDSSCKVVLFQGWMSKDRGLQPLVNAMPYVDENIHLVFMGYGEAIDELQAISENLKIKHRVHFKSTVSQDELLFWTSSADAGFIPYQPIDLNNYYCSPNKLFEFIQAQLPIIANDLPFLKKVIDNYKIGITRKLETEIDYANAIKEIFNLLNTSGVEMKQNLLHASKELCWEVEEKKLLTIYKSITSER